MKIMRTDVIFVGVMGLLIYFIVNYTRAPIESTETAAQSPTMKIIVAKEAVTARLKDPDSAQWGDAFVSSVVPQAVCGSVNAKNGFGGYAGHEQFIAMIDGKTAYMQSDVADWPELWGKMCGRG